MKAFLTLLSVIVLASSCKNVEKMIDKGNYDQAINFAVDKLQGQKNKKTKYVKALEEAYIKVNDQDLYDIEKLLASTSPHRYDKVYDIYSTMEARQTSVLRLDPLVSKDGYVAEFKTRDYIKLQTTAADLAKESHYNFAQSLLYKAENGDKYAARSAYQALSYIERYDISYRDTDKLYKQAYDLGVDHIGVLVKVNTNSPISYAIADVINHMDVSTLDDFWSVHHLNPSKSIPLDYSASIVVDNIVPGFDKEYYNTYHETREVEDGTKIVKDLNGNIVRDSLGNAILTTKYRTATATVREVHREKSASILGRVVIHNTNTNSMVKSVPLHVTHVFDDYSATYQGELQALSNESRKRLKDHCDQFPSDYDMILAMSDNFRNGAYNLLDSRYRRDY